MKLSSDYLQEALEKLGDMAEGKKAEALKIHRNTLICYKNGERIMDDYACIVVAEYLGIDPLEIIAAANMEREKSQARRDFWQDFRKKIAQLVVGGLVITTMAFSPVNTEKAPQGV
ncbi:hypothetical protein [Vogesella indigofera]|uniref:hypothetical protein n=1 Tax=Vogesella indigofera TaxID=45465 RepID=UPI00234EF062|nr:hypothetical protein [Vogesella indigofera]MDC7712206.1 hypothetical protein [Vogesella indigofera]